MKRLMTLLIATTTLPTFGPVAPTQSEGDVFVPGEPAPPLLEVGEDRILVYDGDVGIPCKVVGSGIVVAGADSSQATRASLERTNERAIAVCTEAGSPPSGTEHVTLPDTGAVSLTGLAAASLSASVMLIRRVLR